MYLFLLYRLDRYNRVIMNLLEHEAKTLFSTADIPVPHGQLLTPDSPTPDNFPLILKSQVPTGGRGKAGGIKKVTTSQELIESKESLFTLSIKGHRPRTLLAEELLDIDRELYLAILVDRASQSIKIVAHTQGGVEVEEQKDFQKWTMDGPQDAELIGQELADYYDLASQTFSLQDLVQRLYGALIDNDATLLEINPLVLTKQGKLVAGDGKATLDDAAAFRHEWHFDARPAESNFVTINESGNVATIANGAGLAMATVDAAYDAGLIPANFLDIGGGANTETLLAAFNKIVEYPELQAIIINIFAGITRADEVARAIVAARDQIETLPPLFIRLAGTNYQQAVDILTEHDIAIEPNLEKCLEKASRSIR